MRRAETRHNLSACAGEKGLGGSAPQQAKCKRCYLCPACNHDKHVFEIAISLVLLLFCTRKARDRDMDED